MQMTLLTGACGPRDTGAVSPPAMTFETSRSIPADHPSLPGHFPGAPIVPAVVVLDEIAAAVAKWLPEMEITGIPLAKFLSPLRPGDVFSIRFETDSDLEQVEV